MGAPPPRRSRRRSKWRYGIDHRLERIPRYRAALLQSMTYFGEDFELAAFVAAYSSEDPETINAVTAVEGNLGHIVNWLKQIADFGYLQHDYPELAPKEIHAAVSRTLELLPGLLGRYGKMLKRIDG